ncbi:MAG TPA: type II toxin-antitoxin system RelE/ParE family toxin [Xanthobacteraceae bacterium]|nr:type II toxin-antitoxin system RelE/ParE family toxin [Xanthobacteraceae bacterium]
MPYIVGCASGASCNKGLRRLYETGSGRGIRPDLVAKVEDILHAIEQAQRIEQVGLFPGWKLHPLRGDRRGEWSVWVSGNYRITFRVDGEDVKDIDLEDYHGK